MRDVVDVLSFGEVLWDIIDGVPHIGGAPFNFAAHAVKCGCSAALAFYFDPLGRFPVAAIEILDGLAKA